MTRKSIAAASLLLLFTLASCHSAPELKDPEPIPVPANVPAPKVAEVVKQSLQQRGWVLEGETPGHMDAAVHQRGATAQIGIDYDEKQVLLKYKSGESSRYTSWVRRLSDDIKRNLTFAR